MDLEFCVEDEAFRCEVREFLAHNLTEELRYDRVRSHAIGDQPVMMKWQRILYEKGWVAPSWPTEYGGTGWTSMQRFIWNTELSLVGAPPLPPFGLSMCGPVIMEFGTREQKDYYLPRILSGEHYWCQGYSEPGSGSDLASLKTRAVADGDDYIVNGHKIWTTHAHYADHIFLLVRTDPDVKLQAGISFLLLDMDMPGISVQPIITLAGEHEVNEVFFDNVRVPKTRLIGRENQGWTVAKYLLQFERSGSYAPMIAHVLEDVRCVARQERASDGSCLIEDADFRRQLSDLEIALLAEDILERRIMSQLAAGQNPGATTSMVKTGGTELLQRVTELNMQALAYYAMPDHAAKDAAEVGPDYASTPMACYLNDRAASIYAGSNQVQRNILATAVLGL